MNTLSLPVDPTISVTFEVKPECGHTMYETTCLWCLDAQRVLASLLKLPEQYKSLREQHTTVELVHSSNIHFKHKKVLYIRIPLAELQKVFPLLDDNAEIVLCETTVCKFPGGQGEIRLNRRFMYTDEKGNTYVVHAATFGNKVMYHIEAP